LISGKQKGSEDVAEVDVAVELVATCVVRDGYPQKVSVPPVQEVAVPAVAGQVTVVILLVRVDTKDGLKLKFTQ
jgi:uncharacterized protein (UPF0264 family)